MMFDKRRDNNPEEPESSFDSPEVKRPPAEGYTARSTAVIGSTVKIKGEVTGGENLVIEGTVEGSVELAGHDLTIGQKGQVNANLAAKTVKVEGQLTGDISGSEKVVLTRSGRMLGNIVAPRVTLEDGAKFKGSIDMDPGLDMPVVKEPPKRPTSAESEGAKTEATQAKRAQSS